MYHVFVLYLCTVAFPELGLVDAFHRITQSGKAPLDLDFGVKPKALIVHSSLSVQQPPRFLSSSLYTLSCWDFSASFQIARIF